MRDFLNEKELNTLNHSCAHVMAQAVKHLYPQAKFWVGPVVEEGFYYDIDLGDKTISEEDLPKIEKEMKKICKDGKRIIRSEITKEEALEKFKDDENLLLEKIDAILNNEDLKKNLSQKINQFAKPDAAKETAKLIKKAV